MSSLQPLLNLVCGKPLKVAVPSQAGSAGLDLEELIGRAQTQFNRLEEQRLAWAPLH
jgi:hypothetical protein